MSVQAGPRVPVGSVPVLAAVATAALSAYAALAVATRAVDRADVPALTTFWALCFLVGPAAFIPVEQAFGSEAARRRSAGLASDALLRPALRAAALIAGGVCAAALVSHPFVVDQLFDGTRPLLYAVLVAMGGYAVQHIARASLLAAGLFGRYAVVIALDGGLRLAGCLALAAAGSTSPTAYAWVIALGPALAALGAAGAMNAAAALSARERVPSMLGPTLLLLVGSLAAQALINVPPLVIKASAPPLAAISASAYLVNASLAQSPLLLGQALMSPLLADLSAAVGRRDPVAFSRDLRRLLSLIVLVGAVAVVTIAAAAPVVVRLVFGDDLVLGRTLVAGLSVAGLLFLLAHALTQAAVAASLNRVPGIAWTAGLAAFFVALAPTAPTPGRVICAAITGGAVTVAVLTLAVRSRVSAGRPSGQSVTC